MHFLFHSSSFAGPDGATTAISALLAISLVAWSIIRGNEGAEARGKNGWLVMMTVFLIRWPISLPVWIALRPEHRRKP